MQSNGETLEGGSFQGTLTNSYDEQGMIDIQTIRDYAKPDENGYGALIGLTATHPEAAISSQSSLSSFDSEFWQLISKMYRIDPSLSVKEYYTEILQVCDGEVDKLFEALTDANTDIVSNKIDKSSPLYSFVVNSLAHTSSELYAQQKINPGEKAFASLSAQWLTYFTDEELEVASNKTGLTEEEWFALLA